MTLNGEMALILTYFNEFDSGPYFALFRRIRVRCRRKTIDTVRHSTLLHKLAQLHIPDQISNWLPTRFLR